MKTLSLIIAFCSLSAISCSRDNNTSETQNENNYFQIDSGSKNPIMNVNLHSYVLGDQNISTFIFTNYGKDSNGISISKTIQVGFKYLKTESIAGTYHLGASSRPIDPAGTWFMEYNGTTGQSYGNVTDATCTVDKTSSTNYNVSFSFISQDGHKVSGQYNGKVIVQ